MYYLVNRDYPLLIFQQTKGFATRRTLLFVLLFRSKKYSQFFFCFTKLLAQLNQHFIFFICFKTQVFFLLSDRSPGLLPFVTNLQTVQEVGNFKFGANISSCCRLL